MRAFAASIGVSYEEIIFAEQEIVLLADKVHHLNVNTKSQQGLSLFESREYTVECVKLQNSRKKSPYSIFCRLYC